MSGALEYRAASGFGSSPLKLLGDRSAVAGHGDPFAADIDDGVAAVVGPGAFDHGAQGVVVDAVYLVVAAGVAVVVACAIEVVDTDWVLIPAGTFTTI